NVSFTVDTTAPRVTINSPANTTYAVTSVWANVTLNENTGNVTAQLDATTNFSLTNSSGNWNFLLTSLSEGAHNVKIFANDSLGNMNSTVNVSFTVDTTAPRVTINSPLNTTYANTSIAINVTLNEDSGNVTALVDGATNYSLTNSSGDWHALVTGLAQGAHNILIQANDSVGNMNRSVNINFTIDTLAPIPSIWSPDNISYSSTNISLNVTANEPVSVWRYSLNGGTNTSFTPNITILAAEGANNIRVAANDSVNNTGYAQIFFTVDTTAPRVTINSPA
ncbi:MAG: Ig-like domain-containing protein, partial [Pseudomonadota bacterium]